MMNVIAERMFGVPYIVLDSVFILAFLALLLITKRRLAALWAIAGGVLYFIVDYGIFHLLTGSRHIGTVNADGVFSVGGEGEALDIGKIFAPMAKVNVFSTMLAKAMTGENFAANFLKSSSV